MSKKIFMLFISAILVLSLSMINCTNVGKGGPDGHDKEKVEPGHEGHDHAPGEGHGEDDGHDHSGAQGSYRVLHIETDIIKKWGIQYTSPEPRDFTEKIELTGVAKENMDTSFMINARVGGTVESVKKDIGDNVKKNDILCTLNSSELLEKKTDYIKAF
ncbi:MAG: efflux RND transporter periplasmic adaptor subunit, partial [bacterium]|nr:efflux RND transporter periplasmic adaptor subunit [bacterium]